VTSSARIVFCIAIASVGSVRPTAQQTFTTSTRVVPVYATVTDARGLVVNLNESDFEISDNGARQPITVFRNDIQPITIAILLDASPSLFPVAARTAATIAEFSKHLLPDDRACLGRFSQAVTLDPSLTADPAALLRRLDTLSPWPAGTAIWDAIDAGRAALAAEGGRRVVLIVSDGADNASRVDPDVTRSQLQRDGVMVYSIAVRGRFGLDTSETGALANATGGRSLELKSGDDVAAAMRTIADELHHQYVIGFSPEKLDDKVHRLDVRVKRPGVTVRARRTFVASKDGVR
jgi:Ca-activated chloride channel family protein